MAEKIYNMQDSLTFGKKGEEVIEQYMRNKPYVSDVLDVRDDPIARIEDIDYYIVLNNGSKYPIEIKTDSYASGNLFVEELSNTSLKTLGCFVKTKATFVFYFFINEGILYIINTQKFLDWYWKNKYRFRFCPEIKNIGYGNKPYASCGSLVPRTILESECEEFIRRRVIK